MICVCIKQLWKEIEENEKMIIFGCQWEEDMGGRGSRLHYVSFCTF